MILEDFYVLNRGRHFRYKHGAMMRLPHELVIRQIYIDGGRGSGFCKLWTGAISGQVWVEHPISMATLLCLEFIGGEKKLLEWQTYTVELNNGSLLMLIKTFLLFASFGCHFFLYFWSLPPLVSFFVAFFMCPVAGSGHLKLGWGHLCTWVWQ